MQLVAWNDYLKTGIELVDQQHRGLVDLANETAARLADGATLSGDEIRGLLAYLIDYAEVHFGTEEALMALAGLDGRHVEHHRHTHSRFMRRVREMQARAADNDGTDGRQLMDFLGGWLIHHILGDDRAMARQLRALGAGTRAGQAFDDDVSAPPDQRYMAATRSLAQLHAAIAQANPPMPVPERPLGVAQRPLTELVAESTAALAAGEDRFLALFHEGSLPAVIMPIGADLLPSAVTDANPAACALLGYAREEIVGLTPAQLVAPDESARLALVMCDLLTTGRFDGEMVHLTKAGRPLRTRVSLTHLMLGGRLVALGILQATTEDEACATPTSAAAALAASHRGILALLPDLQDGGIDPEHAVALLGDHPLFRDVAADDLAQLAASSRVKRLRKGEILFQSGDSPRGLFLVVKGQVKLAVSSAQGNEKVVDIAGPQQTFGEAEAFMNRPYPVFAQGLTHAIVLQLGQTRVQELLAKDGAFAHRVVERLGLRVHDLVRSMESYALRSSTERVVAYLLQHAYHNNQGQLEVVLPAQKQVIASLLHITPPTLSRIFQYLSEAGLICMKGRRVKIPDAERLPVARPPAAAGLCCA